MLETLGVGGKEFSKRVLESVGEFRGEAVFIPHFPLISIVILF